MENSRFLGTASELPPLASPAQVAKGALRRLAQSKLEPTPENYAKAYAEEQGSAQRPVLPTRSQAMVERMAQSLLRDEASRQELMQAFMQASWTPFERLLEGIANEEANHSRTLAALIERLVRGLERNDRQWTRARKKDSVQTVLDGSRADARRLQQRLSQLIASWEVGSAEGEARVGVETPEAVEASAEAAAVPQLQAADVSPQWAAVLNTVGGTLVRSLPADDDRGASIADAMTTLLARVSDTGPEPALDDGITQQCGRAERLLQRRNLLLAQMHGLCEELTAGLTDLAEDDSWARGQCDAMREKLEEGLTARGVRGVTALLHTTRTRQRQLRTEREQARDALKSLIHQMLQEVGELGNTTGRFGESVGRYAEVIANADSLESLAGVVREMVDESHTVQVLVSAAQQRLHDEHARTSDLAERVQSLEGELRRLSDEVSTDQLTQIANRRGLIRAFEAERSRAERGEATLSLGLLDVDNFKRLNDELGHSAGDMALRALAERVQQSLRPMDTVARYGGEEFVVMLPNTPIEEAQQVLSRMQRAMTQALFMHDTRPIFVTFSAGVTSYREGELLEQALERADEALYDAKRTGKNRTCVG